MWLKRFVILIVILILFAFLSYSNGDAMAERPKKENSQEKIDLSDGVDKKEAIILARNYLIQKGLEKNVIILRPKVKVRSPWNDCWSVYFPQGPNIKGATLSGLFVVRIDKNTGEIKSAGWPK